jgi:hypothetical protein
MDNKTSESTSQTATALGKPSLLTETTEKETSTEFRTSLVEQQLISLLQSVQKCESELAKMKFQTPKEAATIQTNLELLEVYKQRILVLGRAEYWNFPARRVTSKVFTIAEILENVFWYLRSPRSLANCMRVNKSWFAQAVRILYRHCRSSYYPDSRYPFPQFKDLLRLGRYGQSQSKNVSRDSRQLSGPGNHGPGNHDPRLDRMKYYCDFIKTMHINSAVLVEALAIPIEFHGELSVLQKSQLREFQWVEDNPPSLYIVMLQPGLRSLTFRKQELGAGVFHSIKVS